MSIRIHHIELFYFVAKFGGICEAVRHMPYGIQQPAISSQILQLEDDLGVTLFHRRPFQLTDAGKRLYAFAEPFFGNVDAIENELRGGAAQHIRIGASEVVLQEHLPPVLQMVRSKFPKMRLTLRDGYQPQLEAWLQKQEIDLAITILESKPPSGLNGLALLKLPLVLVVNTSSRLTSAEALWKRDRIDEPLVCLPANEAICRRFQEGLTRLGVDWFPSIEVSSLHLLHSYVASGYGIGLTLSIPKVTLPKQLRLLPLEGFSPITIGVLWQGRLSALAQALLKSIEEYARSLVTEPA